MYTHTHMGTIHTRFARRTIETLRSAEFRMRSFAFRNAHAQKRSAGTHEAYQSLRRLLLCDVIKSLFEAPPKPPWHHGSLPHGKSACCGPNGYIAAAIIDSTCAGLLEYESYDASGLESGRFAAESRWDDDDEDSVDDDAGSDVFYVSQRPYCDPQPAN
jgi:hypothetical protein